MFDFRLLTEHAKVHVRRWAKAATSHNNNLSVRHFAAFFIQHNNYTKLYFDFAIFITSQQIRTSANCPFTPFH